MTWATVAGRYPMRPRLDPGLRRPGPALRKGRLPLAALGVSALGHALFVLGLLATVMWGGWRTEKVQVVNLVPTVAAVGDPNAPAGPVLPVQPPVPQAPRVPTPVPLPPAEPRPAPAREAPARETPSLPAPSLPASRPVARPALPRPGEKELPPVAGASGVPRGEKTGEGRPAPTSSLGTATGSTSGTGALTLDVSDFPYAWYLRQVLQKVEGQWQRQNRPHEPEQKPLVFVEIQRDGSIRMPRIEKSSGNSLYDQAALRAVMEASPFPPLPEDWSKPSLRVLFRFDVRRG